MNKEDTIRMAREAGFSAKHTDVYFDRQLERFAALVAAAEREACAKVCEFDELLHYDPVVTADNCAAAIRARGQV